MNWWMNAGDWTPLLPKSHAGLHFLLSYESFAPAKAPCKCVASPFPIIILRHMPLPLCYPRAASAASQCVLSVCFFCNYHVFFSHCSQTPSINKQTHAAQLTFAAVWVRSTEGQDAESSRGVPCCAEERGEGGKGTAGKSGIDGDV